jgi:hypothetical protein
MSEEDSAPTDAIFVTDDGPETDGVESPTKEEIEDTLLKEKQAPPNKGADEEQAAVVAAGSRVTLETVDEVSEENSIQALAEVVEAEKSEDTLDASDNADNTNQVDEIPDLEENHSGETAGMTTKAEKQLNNLQILLEEAEAQFKMDSTLAKQNSPSQENQVVSMVSTDKTEITANNHSTAEDDMFMDDIVEKLSKGLESVSFTPRASSRNIFFEEPTAIPNIEHVASSQREIDEDSITTDKTGDKGSSADLSVTPPLNSPKEESDCKSQTLEDSELVSILSEPVLLQSGKELLNLKQEAVQLRSNFDRVHSVSSRFSKATTTPGKSFDSLHQYTDQVRRQKLAATQEELTDTKAKLIESQKKRAELRDELATKQAGYVAEVQSRLKYQNALQEVVQLVQEQCSDSELLQQILSIAGTVDTKAVGCATENQATETRTKGDSDVDDGATQENTADEETDQANGYLSALKACVWST